MESLTFVDRIRRSWNAFTNRDPTPNYGYSSVTYTNRPDRVRLTRGNERSIVTAIYNRIALDVAAIGIRHCQLDDNGRYIYDRESGLNNCLSIEANIDQTGRAFLQDIVMSMFDEGCVAIVPVDTTANPNVTGSYDILSMRTGKVLEWKPQYVKVRVYNENTGSKEDIWVNKRTIGIIENPLYAVINEPNSTMQRLIRKLSLLDVTDENTASGKLDLIIQLPYTVKSEARKAQAEQRRTDIEMQLSSSKYGIAYADAVEKITQLNRPVENQLLDQIKYLTDQVFAQLGMTQAILDGTADEKAMLNYYNRSIEPIISAITDEIKRKFLTKAARSQGQSVLAFRDVFRLASLNDIVTAADPMLRNEVMTSNEIRQKLGLPPSDDPKADQLINSNMPHNQIPIEEDNAGEEYAE